MSNSINTRPEGFKSRQGLQSKIQMFYQMGSKPRPIRELNAMLTNYLMKYYGARNVNILKTKSWTYFPRWSPKELEEGRPWEVQTFISVIILMTFNNNKKNDKKAFKKKIK